MRLALALLIVGLAIAFCLLIGLVGYLGHRASGPATRRHL